jgi:hypothetical protein
MSKSPSEYRSAISDCLTALEKEIALVFLKKLAWSYDSQFDELTEQQSTLLKQAQVAKQVDLKKLDEKLAKDAHAILEKSQLCFAMFCFLIEFNSRVRLIFLDEYLSPERVALFKWILESTTCICGQEVLQGNAQLGRVFDFDHSEQQVIYFLIQSLFGVYLD